MKRPFRVTWKTPTGETATVDIEVESKGQARPDGSSSSAAGNWGRS